jgi:hypothetical protein
MSNTTKLTLPTKFKYSFAEPLKLQEEVIELCKRHDRVYILLPDGESGWMAVQQDKLEALLAQNNAQTKDKNAAIAALDAELADENSYYQTHQERYMTAASSMVTITINLEMLADDKVKDLLTAAAMQANELQQNVTASKLRLKDLSGKLELMHASDYTKSPIVTNATPIKSSGVRYGTITTPSALGGDILAQSTGNIGHVLTGDILSSLAGESITPTSTIAVAGEHVVAPFALRFYQAWLASRSRRLSQSQASTWLPLLRSDSSAAYRKPPAAFTSGFIAGIFTSKTLSPATFGWAPGSYCAKRSWGTSGYSLARSREISAPCSTT